MATSNGLNGHADSAQPTDLHSPPPRSVPESSASSLCTAQPQPKRYAVHIEVRLNARSTARFDTIRRVVGTYIRENFTSLPCPGDIGGFDDVPLLSDNVDLIRVTESTLNQPYLPLPLLAPQIHVYQTAHSDFHTSLGGLGDDDEGEDGAGNVQAASVLELPSSGLEGLWDSLVYEEGIKGKLLDYIYTTLLFSDADVDFNIISWNRVVLLHGPPGTGKTSLARALAQKLSVRLSDRYTHGKLIEINSHSLFSKWFSESGKLVQRLFGMVNECVDDEGAFVVVLIDEVESLTSARKAAMSGSEPSDAIRVVNALLTQLDKLKHRKNVLVITTSNITGAIDDAFIDRADIKQYIGLPPQRAVYWILASCLRELRRARIVSGADVLDWPHVELLQAAGGAPPADPDGSKRLSLRLHWLAGKCQGMSGRTLRRLPVLAHARYIGLDVDGAGADAEMWVEAMGRCLADEEVQREFVERGG